ncbi:MAG: head GIN domain-containing protein [Pseudomonadota bacterium]
MRSKLAVIAISGFAVSAVCLGGAFALGGDAVGDAIIGFGPFGQPRCDVAGASTATSRTLPWDGGGDRVAVDMHADAYYRAGSGDQLVIKGDPALVSHVYVRDGVVGIDCRSNFRFGNSPRLEVTLPGRAFRTFEQRGSGNMHLAGLSQSDTKLTIEGSGSIQADGKVEHLTVRVAGSGDVTATGSAGTLDVDLQGSGDVKLGGLTTKSAHVEINGSGNVEIAPQDASRVDVVGDGSGDLEAAGTTNNLTVSVEGSGDMKLGRLAADIVNVGIHGSGNVEIAPRDALKVEIEGSGDVTLRNEPKKIETSIAGSGDIIHSDGTRQSRHSRERHARADDEAIRAAVRQALAERDTETADRHGDADIRRAAETLKYRIQARVARDLAQAGIDPQGGLPPSPPSPPN